MGTVKTFAALLPAALLPALAGCSVPLQMSGSERAIAMYRESLGPRGSLSVRHDESTRRDAARHQTSTPDAAPRVLTVEDAVVLAKKNSAQLSALEAGAATAEAGIAAANKHTNPELRISQIRLNQFVEGEPQIRTAVRFSPDRPGDVDAEVAEARAEQAEAQAEARAEEITIEADVRWLFDDVALIDAEIAAARAVAEARRALAAQMKNRLAAAEATSIDEAMAELAAVEAESDLAEQQAHRREVLGELLDRIGLEPGASVEVVGEPPLAWPPPDLPSEQALIEEALRRRPEVAIAAARIDAADARAYAERARRFPWFSFVELGYQFTPGTPATPGTLTGLAWTFQAGVELPIFDTNRAGAAAAGAAKTSSERALAGEVEQVAREVRARLREAEASRALVTEFRTRALPAAAQAGTASKRALEGRNVDVVEALSVDAQRVKVELRLLALVRRYRTAVSELRRAVGGHFPAAASRGAR
ncbi:TolC family protein [Polyangium jinanense]|uniref:TolC family protein n=1 Tax=Polyangium jinanense TaxID=2829994 RepID=A0A9X3XGY2_9BACT|nr:TolC family protein [Polyangium jinanense]MDC3960286.1 TolC family protein [Polyangium jinanense]MDC3988503.1 TolC family protein [Polyangium jinanense]